LGLAAVGLFVTPVFFVYVDALQRRFRRWLGHEEEDQPLAATPAAGELR